MSPQSRWIIAIGLIGALPLAIVNVVGVPDDNTAAHRLISIQNPSQIESRILRTTSWRHGWPLWILARAGELPVPPPPRRYWRISDPPRPLPSPSSRWPFDNAVRFWWLSGPRLTANTVSWTLLLVGTSIAARRSRFVECGKLQFSLLTYLLAVTFAAVYLGLHLNGLIAGLERAPVLALLMSATIGYGSIVTRTFRWDRRNRTRIKLVGPNGKEPGRCA